MNHRCPVCMFDRLPYPPADYHICPCCGTEFGNDDAEFSHDQLRELAIELYPASAPVSAKPKLRLGVFARGRGQP